MVPAARLWFDGEGSPPPACCNVKESLGAAAAAASDAATVEPQRAARASRPWVLVMLLVTTKRGVWCTSTTRDCSQLSSSMVAHLVR